MEYRALLDRLQDGRFRKLHLSQKALRARMKESGFLAGLPATLGARRVRCSEVLSWCQHLPNMLIKAHQHHCSQQGHLPPLQTDWKPPGW